MVPLIVQIVIALSAYAFAIYCGVVIFRNVQTRCLVRDQTIACSPVLGFMLLFLVALIEVAIYIQFGVLRDTASPLLPVSKAYNVIWPLLYGLVAAYVIGCVVTEGRTRSAIVTTIVVSVPICLALWIAAQWHIFNTVS